MLYQQYLRCFTSKTGLAATVEEVRAALPVDIQGLEVTYQWEMTRVVFPVGASFIDILYTRQVLQQAGFTVDEVELRDR